MTIDRQTPLHTTFEWDDNKSTSNFEKHGITFDDAAKVFDDPYSFEYLSHSEHLELRCVIVGMSRARLVSVIYTVRSARIRIISARVARREERKLWNANTS